MEVRKTCNTPEPEIWGPERTAYFMLINCLTKEEWDRMVPEVVSMGVDPAKIVGIDMDHRDTLPTDAERPEYARQQKAELERMMHSSKTG